MSLCLQGQDKSASEGASFISQGTQASDEDWAKLLPELLNEENLEKSKKELEEILKEVRQSVRTGGLFPPDEGIPSVPASLPDPGTSDEEAEDADSPADESRAPSARSVKRGRSRSSSLPTKRLRNDGGDAEKQEKVLGGKGQCVETERLIVAFPTQ